MFTSKLIQLIYTQLLASCYWSWSGYVVLPPWERSSGLTLTFCACAYQLAVIMVTSVFARLRHNAGNTIDRQVIVRKLRETVYLLHSACFSEPFLWLWPDFWPESGRELNAVAIQGGAEESGGDDAPITDRDPSGKDPRGANRINRRP